VCLGTHGDQSENKASRFTGMLCDSEMFAVHLIRKVENNC
jgi:hypothetical protein